MRGEFRGCLCQVSYRLAKMKVRKQGRVGVETKKRRDVMMKCVSQMLPVDCTWILQRFRMIGVERTCSYHDAQ